jgi:DNA-binding transcriptional LysR family regulator
MERLDDLVLFVEVVEHAGFAAAARSLGMQRSKLSRRIAELEQRMGVRLLQRNTRRVSMTPAGEQVYGHARTVSEQARAAFNVAAEWNGEPRGALRLTCPAPFAAAALTTVVAEFCRLHPQLHVLIDASDRKTDLIGEGFELAFRAQGAPLDDSSMVARLIGDVPMMVVVNPTLLASQDRLQHPDQLLELGLLAHATHDGVKSLQFSQGGRNVHTLHYTPRLSSGNISVLQAAAIAGMGAACLPRYLCRDALATGQLIDAFDSQAGWRSDAAQIYAIQPARRGIALATRLFLEFSIPRLAKVLRGEV